MDFGHIGAHICQRLKRKIGLLWARPKCRRLVVEDSAYMGETHLEFQDLRTNFVLAQLKAMGTRFKS
ncbi:hypothetical protein M5D96_011091, partial [Drosophila gunungcola]